MTRRPFFTWAFLAALLGSGTSARASDGVIEINQQIALAGGVTGGLSDDPAGFPVRIAQPGSYRLTGNLDVRVAAGPENVDAIEVAVDDVSIDLNGFAILGPTVCSGSPGSSLSCAPLGTGRGIDASGRSNVSISGGSVNGSGSDGIVCGSSTIPSGCRVEQMHVRNAGGYGLLASGVISACTTTRSRLDGIRSVGGSTARGNSSSHNGGYGMYANVGDTFEGNSSSGNVGDGIGANRGATLSGNSAYDNGGDGIQASGPVLVIDNVVYNNEGFGINATYGGAPISYVGYGRNMIYNNHAGSVSGGTQLGPNLCYDTICP
jgi:hypothetical protein